MRAVLDEQQIHPAARERIASLHRDLIEEVKAAVAAHDVVVVGMAQNPHPRRAKKLLKARGIAFHALSYGSYLSMWYRRNALKMWTGWPTFPMIFIKGVFIGGADELARLDASGELATLLASRRPPQDDGAQGDGAQGDGAQGEGS